MYRHPFEEQPFIPINNYNETDMFALKKMSVQEIMKIIRLQDNKLFFICDTFHQH